MRTQSHRSARRRRQRRGVAALETAIVLIPVLMFLMGILEYSRYLMVMSLAGNACREGARYAVVHTYDKTTADIQAVTLSMLAGQGASISGLTVQVYEADPTTGANVGAWTDAKFGESIAVRITGTYQPIVPKLLMMGNTIPVSIQAVMNSEAN
ncbi:MAG: TadE/TadG family type IV pilus assembly protein [Isosphaeraceae bacterium]